MHRAGTRALSVMCVTENGTAVTKKRRFFQKHLDGMAKVLRPARVRSETRSRQAGFRSAAHNEKESGGEPPHSRDAWASFRRAGSPRLPLKGALDVEVLDFQRVLFDELAARLDFVAH